jgi:hypothetical protein
MIALSGPTPKSHAQMTKIFNFYLRLSEGNCQKSQKPPSTYFLLASLLIFEMPMSISGGSAKRLCGTYFLVPITWYFFEKMFFALRKIL